MSYNNLYSYTMDNVIAKKYFFAEIPFEFFNNSSVSINFIIEGIK